MYQTELACFFVGERDYIQGSQIISQTINWLENLPANKDSDITLIDAKFSAITTKQVIASIQSDLDEQKIGELSVLVNENSITVHLFESSNEVTIRTPDTPPAYDNLVEVDKLNGQANFSSLKGDLNSILCSIIAANKKLHANLSDSVYDIWFTGFRNAEIPSKTAKLPTEGIISFNNMMTMGKGPYQTLSKVTVYDTTDSNNPVIDTFIISFAYKS